MYMGIRKYVSTINHRYIVVISLGFEFKSIKENFLLAKHAIDELILI